MHLSVLPARPRRMSGRAGIVSVLALTALTGCGHHKKKTAPLPAQTAPPVQQAEVYQPPPPVNQGTPPARIPPTPVPPGGVSFEDIDFIATHRPIRFEEGLATWYTAPYKGRKSANGQVFSDDALTAAHRTLPMGSLIVVTNLKTRQSAAMRITDRGPFVDGRILDLTVASAKAIGMYRAGMSQVRIAVYQTPKPIDSGGRWCVQIGAFKSEELAIEFKQRLLREFPRSNVIEFPGEDSFWVRIRPEGDDRSQAEQIANSIRPPEGEAYLTRLD